MLHLAEFDFLSDILTDFRLSYVLLRSSADLETFFSGFLQSLDKDKPILYPSDFHEFSEQYRPWIIYRIQNFRYRFLLLRLPDIERAVYMAIGPYTLPDIPSLQQFSIPENADKEPPIIDDDHQLLSILKTFIRRTFRDADDIPVQNLKFPESSDPMSMTETFYLPAQDDPLFTIRMVEEYYDNENELMKLVSQGHWHKAEKFLNTFLSAPNFYRLCSGENSLTTKKIQSHDLNTLLRKAVESADVHPMHIETLYSQFSFQISQASSLKDIHSLQREIVRSYCKLVQIHSLKGYSPIIQKVMTHITSNLSGDLTLNAQANLLNINPSYLSALFKKETGSTLTEYVKQKRVNHAVFLLSTTDLQIQAIAELCGISDVNYFTKIFKKIIGQTPKEYRDKLLQ